MAVAGRDCARGRKWLLWTALACKWQEPGAERRPPLALRGLEAPGGRSSCKGSSAWHRGPGRAGGFHRRACPLARPSALPFRCPGRAAGSAGERRRGSPRCGTCHLPGCRLCHPGGLLERPSPQRPARTRCWDSLRVRMLPCPTAARVGCKVSFRAQLRFLGFLLCWMWDASHARDLLLRKEEKKVNCKPKNQDEQEIPFRLREIMRSRQEMQHPGSNKKRRKEGNEGATWAAEKRNCPNMSPVPVVSSGTTCRIGQRPVSPGPSCSWWLCSFR